MFRLVNYQMILAFAGNCHDLLTFSLLALFVSRFNVTSVHCVAYIGHVILCQ